MTKSEKYVADLCNKSFLPFWSFPSPIGKKGNELCDLLIVCQNIIIIISVKEIEPSKNEDKIIVYKRWVKKAINESVSQIYGAEKYIATTDIIHLRDSDHVINLPPKADRIIYRIAIAFGSKDYYPLPMGLFEKGYVNVFDEKSTEIILKELDTITDFTKYLLIKQNFLKHHTVLASNEADFLAFYLETGLLLESHEDRIIILENCWKEHIESDDYKKWKADIEVSYVWDIMIQSLYRDNVSNIIPSKERNSIEEALRLINLEPRVKRVKLGLLLEDTIKTKLKARMVEPFGDDDHAYVFMPLDDKNWESREAELTLRCDVARTELLNTKKVIGIAIGSKAINSITFDVHYIDIPEIDDNFVEYTKLIKEELGFFKNIRQADSKATR